MTDLLDEFVSHQAAIGVVAAGSILFGLVALASALGARRERAKLIERSVRAEHELAERELEYAEQSDRMRVISELNELAATDITGLVTSAEAAVYLARSDPDGAVRGLGVLVEAAKTVRADLRRATDLVVSAAPPSVGAGLDSVERLLAVVRTVGLEVSLEESGVPPTLASGEALTVYRILQEALENSLEHGGPGTSARVKLVWTSTGLQLLVDDDGTRAAAIREGLDPNKEAQQRPYSQEDDLAALTRPLSGPGITEMRERTELFSGVFTVLEVPGVGVSVSAIFPDFGTRS